MPDVTVDLADELITKANVDFIIGPLSGNEGLAMRTYAKQRPERAFLNGSSGAQDTTLRNVAPNFYNFGLNGVQAMRGLGWYAYHTMGYKHVVTLGENYSYPHAQIGGFMVEYYQMGGKVLDKLWVPLGEQDYRQVIAAIPPQADAIFTALGGTDAINFLQQYESIADPKPVFGGAIIADQSVLSAGGEADYLIGIVTGGPTADDNPDPMWEKFVTAYRNQYPDGFNFPSWFSLEYYLNTKAALLALDQVGGDLSNGQAHFRQALDALTFNGPSGPVSLDQRRGAVSNNFIVRVEKDPHTGFLYRKLINRVEDVDQFMGLSEADYLALGTFDDKTPAL